MKNYFNRSKDTCRLLVIDLSKQEVKFQIKMKLPILRCSITQAIHDLNLVTHISSIEACYLGGHYGKIIGESLTNGAINMTPPITSFLMVDSSERCHVLYKDRAGNIGYYDRKQQKEFIDSPLSIAKNEKLIALFSSSQACYIGISAGIQLGKVRGKNNSTIKDNYFNKQKSHLKLVKS